MDSSSSNDVQRVRIAFRAEQDIDSSAWQRAGITSLEQAEAEFQREGVAVTLEQGPSDGGEGTRGFIDAVVVSVVADAVASLLFHIISDLMVRWQKMKRSAAHIGQAIEESGPTRELQVIVHAGKNQTAIPFGTPDDEIYEQLSLWAPYVLDGGQVTFEVAREVS